ncbi:MAG: hypothetical protein JO372_11075 [Solirubrobacterales bacterium]|nr:hypothetical protein [Solirubrobacterales bacterium]
MLPEIDHFPVTVALDAAAMVPPAEDQLDARCAACQRRVGSALEEAIHASALVGFEVQEDHVRERPRVENLADRTADVVVHAVDAGVNQRRALVLEEKLVELKVKPTPLNVVEMR